MSASDRLDQGVVFFGIDWHFAGDTDFLVPTRFIKANRYLNDQPIAEFRAMDVRFSIPQAQFSQPARR